MPPPPSNTHKRTFPYVGRCMNGRHDKQPPSPPTAGRPDLRLWWYSPSCDSRTMVVPYTKCRSGSFCPVGVPVLALASATSVGHDTPLACGDGCGDCSDNGRRLTCAAPPSVPFRSSSPSPPVLDVAAMFSATDGREETEWTPQDSTGRRESATGTTGPVVYAEATEREDAWRDVTPPACCCARLRGLGDAEGKAKDGLGDVVDAAAAASGGPGVCGVDLVGMDGDDVEVCGAGATRFPVPRGGVEDGTSRCVCDLLGRAGDTRVPRMVHAALRTGWRWRQQRFPTGTLTCSARVGRLDHHDKTQPTECSTGRARVSAGCACPHFGLDTDKRALRMAATVPSCVCVCVCECAQCSPDNIESCA